MLHLAQVQKQERSGEPKLRLIARQESGYTWALMAQAEVIPATEADEWGHGLLVLVELSPTRQILSIQDATKWVLDLVKNYLMGGVTPAFLQQEKERLEQGLQSLTLEKLEFSRRSLELEARREEIQELEAKLQQQIQELEARRKEIQELEAKLQQQIQELEERIKLDNAERAKVEQLADDWGVSFPEAIHRIIREFKSG